MAPKGTSVENSQAKGPELDETLESHYDNEVIMTPKKQFPIGKESFRLQDGDALYGRLCLFLQECLYNSTIPVLHR